MAPGVDLGSGGKDRFGQTIGFAKAGRQFDAADGPGLLIVLPSGAREIAADDALNGKHLCPLDEHAAALQLAQIRAQFRREIGRIRGDEMVRDSSLEEIEPEKGELGENLALVGNSAAENMVEGGDSIAGDKEQLVAGKRIDVADLALGGKFEVTQVSLQKSD